MHRVSMLMLRLPLRVFLQAVVLSSLSLLAGCSGSDSKPPVLELSSGPTRPSSVLSTAPCEPWTTRPCGIELGVLGGTVRCQRGTQICEDGVWSACMADASKHSVSIPAAGPATSGGVKLQDVGGGSSTCVDNPCDPVCLKFNDEPSSPASADRVDTPTGWSYGGSLASSNVPTAFKDKGSLNAQCSAAAGSQSFNEACQFDQHCNGGSCTAFGPTDSGSCSGIDITAPTSCIPITSGFRDLTVCNRGTVAAPAGIRCYRYPGGAPQYPNDDPGTGTLVMTTATTLQPGTCETQQVPESLFGQNGIQSIMCNPPQTEIQVVSVGPNYAATNAPLPNLPSWTNPANGYASDGQYATAAPPNPNGAVTGPKFPSANQTFGSDGSWTTQSNAYSDAPAGAYATASPAMPASSTSTGNIGPVNPTTTVDPAVAGDGAWSSVWNALAPDGSYTSAAPANPSTPTVVTKVPSSMLSNSGWINPTNVYASDSQYATATLSAAGTVSATYGTFGFNSIPANAILDSLTLTAKWKGTVNSSKYHLTAQAVTGGTDTPIGLALTKSDPYTGETTDSLTVPATTLSQFVASDFTDANFHVLLSFVRDNGSVSAATASVDAITVSLTYHLPSTVSSFAVGGFGITGIPSGAPVQMTIEVKWKTDVVNSNVVLGLQAYKNWGTASQATIGSELTRTPTSANTVYTDTTPVLAPTPNDLSDSSFKVRVRVLRNPGSTNPDFTAFVDSVRVTVSWTATAAPAPTTSSLVLTNFGLDSLIPANATITKITTAARWKLSTATTHATLGLQAYSGVNPLGTETTDATGPTADTTATQVVTTGLSRTDVSDANLSVRARVSRDSSTTPSNPDFTAYLDYVTVTVEWTAPSSEHWVSYGNFGFNIPADATVTSVTTEAKWKVSASTALAELAFQAFVGAGATALGAEQVDGTAPTSDVIRTQTLSGLSLKAEDFLNGTFLVRVRATRTSGTQGGGNPDFTAYLDFVRVTVTYQHSVLTSVEECNHSNNWTATKLVPDPDACRDMSTPQYVPFTVTRVFQAACPTGTAPLWRNFAYTTSTPPNTRVEFRFRSFAASSDGTCIALDSVTTDPPVALAVASLTQDPETCSMAGNGNPCPKDLSALGTPQDTYACLQMDAHGVPVADATPELIDWNVTYDCVDAQ